MGSGIETLRFGMARALQGEFDSKRRREAEEGIPKRLRMKRPQQREYNVFHRGDGTFSTPIIESSR
jgi:hypothetical protein